MYEQSWLDLFIYLLCIFDIPCIYMYVCVCVWACLYAVFLPTGCTLPSLFTSFHFMHFFVVYTFHFHLVCMNKREFTFLCVLIRERYLFILLNPFKKLLLLLVTFYKIKSIMFYLSKLTI